MSLEEGKYYHFFNRGNNSQKVFFEPENYLYFLRLLDKYIKPVANIYSYCLLKTHYHIVVRIKPMEEVDLESLSYSTVSKAKKLSATSQFSNLFNAYTQAINKKYQRTGNLFEYRFHRKGITTDEYLIHAILYVHSNPNKHKICKTIEEYTWSSYNGIATNEYRNIDYDTVLKLFGGVDNFKFAHQSIEIK